nr:RNA-dependent RNA polymerase [Chuzan virus]
MQDASLVRNSVQRFLKYTKIDGKEPKYIYYRFSKNMREIRRKRGVKYKTDDTYFERRRDQGILNLYGIQVAVESSWEDILDGGPQYDALKIFERSVLNLGDLIPEEEFLRNYRVEKEHPFREFVEMRAKAEMQIYGDLPVKAWCSFIREYAEQIKHEPLGLSTMREFVYKYGSPFNQNSRDLSQIEDFSMSYSTPLLFEMCCCESLIEFNMFERMNEEGIKELEFGGLKINPFDLIREFFVLCLPHPKKINNMLRAPYSWFVKMWGVCCSEVKVLRARGGDDRNSKDVVYDDFVRVKNIYGPILYKTQFYRQGREENISKVEETIKYSQELGNHAYGAKLFLTMLKQVYKTEFDPTNIKHVMLASLLLSIQTITGYGRAWVKNVSSDIEKQMKPDKNNLISRVNEYTRNNFIKAYDEALAAGEDIVKPEDMYTSMLRLARNTSSGFSTKFNVYKKYGPGIKSGIGKQIEITSRIKALVIFQEGHKIFVKEELEKKYNTVQNYQSKGSRDVPIKATRTIYAINLSILIPQLIVTLPLNEYFSKVGGSTRPQSGKLGGKIIVGDLEATGSRVMDAADTFRNSSDPEILTIAIDYSDYDTHLTPYNFRDGMISGIRTAMMKHSTLRYEGHTLDEIVEYGYGEGRVMNTLWNGKRAVYKADFAKYMELPPEDREKGEFRPPRGVKPIRTTKIIAEIQSEDPDNQILVSPVDGSDLAFINTHLSGENSTLVANSMHNLAIGTIIQEEVKHRCAGLISFLSEQYVGDDTLFYTQPCVSTEHDFDCIIRVIFDTIERCGHIASASKTIIAPFSVEKTQTHAKQGIYIPQDRMMLISSERRKDIEDVRGYLKSQVQTLTTKISRGFSHKLARMILMLKTSLVGFRKLKRTIFVGGVYRDRRFDSDDEDGFTMYLIRDPLCAFLPVEWNGVGAYYESLNIVMTEDIFLDLLQTGNEFVRHLAGFINGTLPFWNETEADKRQIGTDAKMSFFTKMARPAVQSVLNSDELTDLVKQLPLGDYSPTNISKTMMHSALLKESSARSILTPTYESEYQRLLNVREEKSFKMFSHDLELSTNYIKMFDVQYSSGVQRHFYFPDQNLSPSFFLQKNLLGPRMSTRVRMSYVDRIDSILRGDVVMRGFITGNAIINILEKIGHTHNAADLSMLFQIMNIESRVADRLAEYISAERLRFGAMKLLKRGICGDEFSMSLDVCTQEMSDNFIRYPKEFTKTEQDAAILYASQLLMIRAAHGHHPGVLIINASAEERQKFKVRAARFKAHLPKLRLIRRLIQTERLSARMVQNQFV